MELWCIVLICSLALAALCLLAYLLVLRHSLREAAEELDEKLRTDTNTLISISSGDRAMQSLVTHINWQLQALRRERLRLHSGNAELTAAVTNVSHDLRTPLTALCGYLDLLEQEPQTEAAARYLAVIRERTDAMRALTEELFRYAVLTATADELHTEPVCLNDVLEQSLAGFYGALSARGITPSVQLPEEKVIRPLDAAACLTIFSATPPNTRTATLPSCSPPDGKVTFSNRASALSRVEAARLFDRFYTVDSARGSTGLGLSIAKLLTEKLHGTISADYENETLRICIAFPIEKQGGI